MISSLKLLAVIHCFVTPEKKNVCFCFWWCRSSLRWGGLLLDRNRTSAPYNASALNQWSWNIEKKAFWDLRSSLSSRSKPSSSSERALRRRRWRRPSWVIPKTDPRKLGRKSMVQQNSAKTRQKPFPSHESESTTLAKSSEESKQYQTLLHTRELHPNFTQHWAIPVNTSQLTGIWTWPRTRKHYTKVTRTRTKLTFRAK